MSDRVSEVASERNSPSAAPHPEEMRVTVDLRIGSASFRATARTTPAGLAATALLVAAILVPSLWLLRGRSAR
ncbi:MAG: hypothetical protein J0H14_22230 [Alphaproteobacteria bacterium]|nr:hypothetical protein [Rhodospirillales bacterium]MBN9563417.1 hypothetical protein [Alphaproteobacteria bacterium]